MFGGLLVDGVDELERSLGVVSFVEIGFDPDGEELRAQVALLGGVEIDLAAVEWAGEIVVFVDEALWCVGVGVNDDGLVVNLGGGEFGVRYGWGHGGSFRRGLRIEKRSCGQEEESREDCFHSWMATDGF